jgi:hypothetical protein
MRYQRQLDTAASSRFRRAFLKLLGIAVVIGFVVGLLWVIAGLLNFQVLR